MTGRSSLFPHHSDFGSKTSLLEEGTAHWRHEKEDSPFTATVAGLLSGKPLSSFVLPCLRHAVPAVASKH